MVLLMEIFVSLLSDGKNCQDINECIDLPMEKPCTGADESICPGGAHDLKARKAR